MSEIPDSAPEEEIIGKILADGEAQAKRVIDNARRAREVEERKAKAQAEKARAEVISQIERRIQTVKSREMATAQIEAKRILLKAREGAISKILGLLARELAKLRERPDEYREALKNLAVEAVGAVGESEVTLRLGKSDQGLADTGFVTEVTRRVNETGINEVTIELEFDPAVTGGCIAISKQGRIVFDNTFTRRLERTKPSLRSMIVKEILRTHV
jgi:vacuolar-type H+-ATPase subunit E/Vma4